MGEESRNVRSLISENMNLACDINYLAHCSIKELLVKCEDISAKDGETCNTVEGELAETKRNLIFTRDILLVIESELSPRKEDKLEETPQTERYNSIRTVIEDIFVLANSIKELSDSISFDIIGRISEDKSQEEEIPRAIAEMASGINSILKHVKSILNDVKYELSVLEPRGEGHCQTK